MSGSGSAGVSKKRRRDSVKHAVPPATPSKNTNTEVGPVAATEEQHHIKVVTHYRPILFVDYMAPGELVIVERPLVDVLATLPPAYFRHKYGAS